MLTWYTREGRDLPWRHTRNPYHILVSEMMLHQTQVARVKEKYGEWLTAYPTFEALASAPLGEVKKLWRPLGYNFRPERLHQIAKSVMENFDGKLPGDLDKLMAFRGIGRYTAGAILSFAFHKDAPIVDTNVRRFIQRIFAISGSLSRAAAEREIWRLAEAIIPTGNAHIFNQALIDFGALVCTPRNPACISCVVSEICAQEIINRRRKSIRHL
ncbi:MAG: A/G-specific adenine glycosylase [Candidatus Bathyarchaeota archaeon]|nr:MAG: A/G-specific adenine glycosylase [Candidatus Bathyarchaeota archaeon]